MKKILFLAFVLLLIVGCSKTNDVIEIKLNSEDPIYKNELSIPSLIKLPNDNPSKFYLEFYNSYDINDFIIYFNCSDRKNEGYSNIVGNRIFIGERQIANFSIVHFPLKDQVAKQQIQCVASVHDTNPTNETESLVSKKFEIEFY